MLRPLQEVSDDGKRVRRVAPLPEMESPDAQVRPPSAPATSPHRHIIQRVCLRPVGTDAMYSLTSLAGSARRSER